MRIVLISLFLSFSLIVIGQPQKVNPILGDTSWLAVHGNFPSFETSEFDRIEAHLKHVVSRLKLNSTDHDLNRKRCIFLLEDYIKRGQFPINTDYPFQRKPCFIDATGNICAVGYLVEMTAGREEAERISTAYQYDYLKDIDDPKLLTWQKTSGLSFMELEMIQPTYDFATPIPVSKNIIFQDSISNKYGLISRSTGKVKLKAKYDQINLSVFTSGVGWVKSEGKYAILSKGGRLKSKLSYDTLYPADYQISKNKYIIGFKNKTAYILNNKGTVVFKQYGITGLQWSEPYFKAKYQDKWGIIDKNGKWIIDPIYESVDYKNWLKHIKVQGENGMGLLNMRGEIVIPLMYSSINKQKRTWIAQRESKIVLFSEDGKQSELTGITKVLPYGNSFYDIEFLAVKNNKYGLLGGDQKWKIPPIYDKISRYLDYHMVEKDGLTGYYKKSGILILPVEFDKIQATSNSFIVTKAGKMGVMDRNGQSLVSIENDSVMRLCGNLSGGIAICYGIRNNDHWTITKNSGKLAHPFVFDHIERLSTNKFLAVVDSSYYVGSYYKDTISLDSDSTVQKLEVLNTNGVLSYYRNGKYGIAKIRNGTLLANTLAFETAYDEIIPSYYGGRYIVKQNSLYGVITPGGYVLHKPLFTQYKVVKEGDDRKSELLKKGSEWYVLTSNHKIRKSTDPLIDRTVIQKVKTHNLK